MPRTASPNGTINARELLAGLRAIKRGDFRVRLPANQSGVDGEIADVFNEVAQLLEDGAREFSRVGTVVGKEGQIKQRAALGAAAGSWGTLVNSVNDLISDMVRPTEEVSRVIGAVARGDLSQR